MVAKQQKGNKTKAWMKQGEEKCSLEVKKKTWALLSIEYWLFNLFNRDPYNDLLKSPQNWVVQSPKKTLTQEGGEASKGILGSKS